MKLSVVRRSLLLLFHLPRNTPNRAPSPVPTVLFYWATKLARSKSTIRAAAVGDDDDDHGDVVNDLREDDIDDSGNYRTPLIQLPKKASGVIGGLGFIFSKSKAAHYEHEHMLSPNVDVVLVNPPPP